MGVYINTGKAEFESVRVDEYIDKSMLIAYVNSVLGSQQRKFMCVTRARRFGKSIAAKMLCAYYDQSCDSHALFDDLNIAKDPSYEKHINHYPVIYLDVSGFTGDANIDKQRIVQEMTDALRKDLAACYPDAPLDPSDSLPVQLLKVAEFTQKPFIMIVDEWDAVLRELEDDSIKRAYVDWLRTMFKNGFTNRIFAGVYMTGILPIKQYNTESALNNFVEFSMVSPGKLAGYFGFTKQEVHALCKKHKMDEAQIKQWYDGYQMGDKMEIYNPFAVMCAMVQGRITSYWTSTAAYESLKRYITMNFAGLKDAVIELLAGQEVRVDVKDFAKDIHEVSSRDAVLTLLIHLGYLSYDENRGVVRIPNFEVQQEFERTIRDEKEWGRVTKMLVDSERLLADTLAGNAEAVAEAIDYAHQDNTSILQYNDENSLACVLSLAYVAARKDYTMIRELPAGKGFADIVLLPNRNVDKPAVVLELKFNHSADTAIAQIKKQRYAESLKDYVGEVVLVGVNYDKKTKEHRCVIECLSNKSVLSFEKSVLSQDENVLSLLRNCPKLSSKQGNKALAVLRVVGEGEISVADLMKRVGGTNRSRFKAQLIDPFVEALLIAPTIPDKPNSSKQRYYLTDKGIELLKQLTNE